MAEAGRAEPTRRPLRVLFMPEAPGNPYLALLKRGMEENGVEVRMARGPAHILPFIQAVVSGPRPDVFHLHWTAPYLYWPRSGRLSRLLAERLLLQLRMLRRLNVRIVWTMHNIAAHESDDRGLEASISRRIAALCDSLLVHCEAGRQDVLELLGRDNPAAERVFVVPHGHYIGAYPDLVSRQDARRQLGLAQTDRVFLMFGRLRRYKGAHELLSAFRSLPGTENRLILAGKCRTPAIKRDIEELAALDERVITRLGYVPDEMVQHYFRAADVAVLPFRDVLTSGSAVLAMSLGLPVVAPRLGCLPETLSPQLELLYQPDDPGGLQRTLASALSVDLASLGAANRTSVAVHDWRSVGEQTIRLAYQRSPEATPPRR